MREEENQDIELEENIENTELINTDNNNTDNNGIILIGNNWKNSVGEDYINLVNEEEKKEKKENNNNNNNLKKFKKLIIIYNNKFIKFIKEIIGFIILIFGYLKIEILKKKKKTLNVWKSIIKYSINNVKNNKLNISIGFISCFIVVFLIGTGLSILSNISIIYLSKADQISNGIDLIIEPNYNSIDNSIDNNEYSLRLNYSLISNRINSIGGQDDDDDDDLSNIQMIPNSKIITTYGYPIGYCKNLKSNDIENRYYGFNNSECNPSNCMIKECGYPVYMGMKIIDFKGENEFGYNFGYNGKYKEEGLPDGTIIISTELSKRLEISIGNEIYMMIPSIELLSTMLYDIGGISLNEIDESPYIISKFKIIDTFNLSDTSSINGGDGDGGGYHFIVDYRSLYIEMIKQVNPRWNKESRMKLIHQTNLYEYVETILIKLPSPRLKWYSGTDLDETLERILKLTSKILYRIGFSHVTVDTPVMTELYKSKELSSNLGMLLNIIIFVFILLSILLIYSTLMVDVELMTYNNGVFRMLGANFKFVIKLMISKILIFAIPSIVIGLVVSQLFLLFASKELKKLSNQDISSRLTWNAIGYSMLFGLSIPFISLILPIRKALRKPLNESIDTSRSKLKGSKITLKTNGKDQEYRFNISIIGFSISLFGFVSIIFLPYGLLSGDQGMFLTLLSSLLLLVLVGSLFLMINFHLIISKCLITLVTLFDPSRSMLKRILFKNLLSHKTKNKNTIFMFGVSIALILLIKSLYDIQSDSAIYSRKHYRGSVLKIETPDVIDKNDLFFLGNCLDDLMIEKFDQDGNSLPYILGYSVRSIDFSQLSSPDNQLSYISNFGKTKKLRSSVIAIGPNYFDQITYDEIFKVSHYPSKKEINDQDVVLNSHANGKDLSTLLYSKESMKKALLGSSIKKLLNLESYRQPFLLENNIVIKNYTGDNNDYQWSNKYPLLPLGFLDVVATFDLSRLPTDTHQDLIISLPSYLAMSGDNLQSVRDIPINSILIRPKDSDSIDYITSLTSIIQAQCISKLSSKSSSTYILDSSGIVSTEANEKVNSYFFNFATVLSMLISSFSLISSMVTNITNQTKEIGILRSIGLNKFKINRIYIYESFALSFGSCILGLIVGSFISYIMLYEQILITQKLLSFKIQWLLILTLFLSSIFISFLSVLSPINNLLNNSIVKILKK